MMSASCPAILIILLICKTIVQLKYNQLSRVVF